MRLANATAAMVAVAVTAWFLLGARQAHETAQAAAIARSGNLSAAQIAHAKGLLRSASFLNPDRQISLLRAEIAHDRGDDVTAQRILSALTHVQPLDVSGWFALAQVAGSDPRTLNKALKHIAELAPGVSSR